ncbi:hypothetical protein [Flavobacterium defluvii]|uniref:Uncharacterized protein n=1 Tax=Flavobacterium defluvii TaxID=370979 RepID=A0A1M5LTR9_9FLAO|nr:hypothetical protein [Flavobacterium defluvii]SHG68411.1 hypothetical protein SAMN05443663_103460 [Flavobacterium defluvii]
MYQTIKTFVDSAANWLESIGFIITIFTAIKVFFLDKRISDFNKKHLFQTRSQGHISDLKKISKNISDLISDFDNKKTELKIEVKKSEEVAKSIKKKLPKKDIKNTKSLIKEAVKIEKLPENLANLNTTQKLLNYIIDISEFNEDTMNDYYVKLSGLITSLEELKKDYAKSLIS